MWKTVSHGNQSGYDLCGRQTVSHGNQSVYDLCGEKKQKQSPMVANLVMIYVENGLPR